MLKNLRSKAIILENGRCVWGRCIFCSLSKKTKYYNKTEEELKEEFLRKIGNLTGEDVDVLKIYNSGVFIDDAQIPRGVRKFIFDELRERNINHLVIEIWPPFFNDVKAEQLKEDAKNLNLHLAMGLESADDKVLLTIEKGSTLNHFIKASEVARKHGFYVRAYVMVNLPGVKDIKKDFENTMNIALKYADSIAVLNTFAYSGYAKLFDLWLESKWKPLTKEEFLEITKPYHDNPKVEIYEKDYIIYPHFPEEYREKAKEELKGATLRNLTHPYYEIWQEFLSKFYEKPPIKRYALFMHCSYKKPYSLSKTHKKIIKYLQRSKHYHEIHQLIISNPGVVPREFENKFPFNAYDWPEYEETEEIKSAYIKINAKRIEEFLKRHEYEIIFSYLKPESESLKALEIALKNLDMERKHINLLDKRRYNEIKNIKGSYIDDLLLERMVEELDKSIEEFEKNILF